MRESRGMSMYIGVFVFKIPNYYVLFCYFSEQEIQDVIKDSSENSSFLRKDVVFARMTFTLSKGSFRLLESSTASKSKSFTYIKTFVSFGGLQIAQQLQR